MRCFVIWAGLVPTPPSISSDTAINFQERVCLTITLLSASEAPAQTSSQHPTNAESLVCLRRSFAEGQWRDSATFEGD